MATPHLTPVQLAEYNDDRRTELYGSLLTLLVLNNLAVAARLLAHYRKHYRTTGRVYPEDPLILLSEILVDVIIGNLLASTHYGLGLHSWRINAEDPRMPYNISTAFEHVWVCMVFTGPTFTAAKLTLLFFYRRLFLVQQRWLRIAWWINLVYIILWFFGATGFYLFQCWPVEWYWMQYYKKYHIQPPYAIQGQCNATSVMHVAMPLIFGLFSDVALLLLPITAISKLQISLKKRLGLACVFSVGLLACALGLYRIIELLVNTDDKLDPSYGVVVFLILTAAEGVCAVICASLPVIIPQVILEYRLYRGAGRSRYGSGKLATRTQSSNANRGFRELVMAKGDQTEDVLTQRGGRTERYQSSVPMNNIVTVMSTPADNADKDEDHILVETRFEVTSGDTASSSVRDMSETL